MAVGTICATITPAMASRLPTTKSPKKDSPRCLDLNRCVIYFPLTLKEISIERPDALQTAEVHPDKKRFANNVFVRHKTPVARIQRIIAVITHHEVMALRHFAHHTLHTVVT